MKARYIALSLAAGCSFSSMAWAQTAPADADSAAQADEIIVTGYYFVSAMFVPFPVVMLPIIKLTSWLGMTNQIGLIVLYAAYGLSFNVFIYVGFINTLPRDLEDAAAIDGCGLWQTFWSIVFPLLSPVHATVGIITCLWAWNDFLLPLIVLSDPSMATLPLVQFSLQDRFNAAPTVAFASYLLAMAPLLVVYLVAQRWIIGGVVQGAIKG